MLKISAENLSKSFNGKIVFENISFELESRDILFVTGRNGSGKTTLLKIVSGIIKPDSGKIKIEGEESRRLIFIGHENALYRNLTVYENISLFGKIWRKNLGKEDIRKILEIFSVEEFIDEFVINLSQGTRKKVELAKIIICEPKILVIDEPFSNLDEYGKEKLKKIMQSITQDGIVIFSSPKEEDMFFSKKIQLGEQ